jgi:hypothetical protein
MKRRLKKLSKWLKSLLRGKRDYRVEGLVTPKWARSSMRSDNRFRRAMGRTQLPILKRWKLDRHVTLGGNLAVLREMVHKLETSHSYLRWLRNFYRNGKETLFSRILLRMKVKKNRNLIRHTIEY